MRETEQITLPFFEVFCEDQEVSEINSSAVVFVHLSLKRPVWVLSWFYFSATLYATRFDSA